MVVHAVATCQLKIIWNLIQEHSQDNYKFSRAEKRAPNPSGAGGGGYSGFQVTEMIKVFFSVSNFRFRDLFGQENFSKYLFGSLI